MSFVVFVLLYIYIYILYHLLVSGMVTANQYSYNLPDHFYPVMGVVSFWMTRPHPQDTRRPLLKKKPHPHHITPTPTDDLEKQCSVLDSFRDV